MPVTNEITQIGKREDLADIIAVADAKKTILASLINKGRKPTNSKFGWQVDKYADASTAGTIDGTDVSAYENAAENRARLENHVQVFRRTPRVTRLAEYVSTVAGVNNADMQGVAGGTEFARAKAKKVIEVKRDIETTLLSDNDAQADDGSVPYKTRGLGVFLQNSAQSYLPVPSAYRTPSASIYSGAASSFAEDDARTLLQTRWENTGTPDGNLIGIMGSTIKNRWTDFIRYQPTVSSFTSIRYFENSDMRKLETVVDFYTGDYGTVELHLSSFLPNNKRAYILDPAYLELRTHTAPYIEQLPDLGGGPRALIEAIVGLAVLNPLAHAKIAAS
jgi:hypothetical protein